MDLDAQHLVHYLLERGLLETAEVVDGGLLVAESSRRHRSFQVLRPGGGGLFVKQVRQRDAETITTFQREGACYWLAANDEAFAPLRKLMPAFVDYDREHLRLVIELLPDAEDLTLLHRRRGDFPSQIGARLGETLGSYQAAMKAEAIDDRYSALFPRALPWPLICRQVPTETFSRHGAAAGSIVETIKGDESLFQPLEALKEEWQPSTLMHGDLKWDNLMSHPNGSPETKDLKLIDWELADIGDPLWDAGAVFHAYLVCWLLSLPFDNAQTQAPEQWLSQAGSPVELMRPALGEFWRSYRSARGITINESEETLLRCLRFGAVRLLQTAFELAAANPQALPQGLFLVQACGNILKRPENARRHLEL